KPEGGRAGELEGLDLHAVRLVDRLPDVRLEGGRHRIEARRLRHAGRIQTGLGGERARTIWNEPLERHLADPRAVREPAEQSPENAAHVWNPALMREHCQSRARPSIRTPLGIHLRDRGPVEITRDAPRSVPRSYRCGDGRPWRQSDSLSSIPLRRDRLI